MIDGRAVKDDHAQLPAIHITTSFSGSIWTITFSKSKVLRSSVPAFSLLLVMATSIAPLNALSSAFVVGSCGKRVAAVLNGFTLLTAPYTVLPSPNLGNMAMSGRLLQECANKKFGKLRICSWLPAFIHHPQLQEWKGLEHVN